jgi:hypothetical protein
MTDALPGDADRALADHDGFERADGGYTVRTTVFENNVTADDLVDEIAYTVTVEVPSLQAATADTVGPAVREGWLETLERRLEDAPKATRAGVNLEEYDMTAAGETVIVTYTFTYAPPARAADIAKSFVEYVEGTYVEGIVPGYDYTPPVSDLIQSASQGESEGEGTRGGTPL